MPSRISSACNTCRAKKQKCSGDQLGCAQCRDAGHECTWPMQRKRGPTKGYIEGLEHRVQETERLLLHVLPVLPEDQLAAVIPRGRSGANSDLDSSSLQVHVAASNAPTNPRMLNNKTGVEYWEEFPLDSVQNIHRWQQDCTETRSSEVRGVGATDPFQEDPSRFPQAYCSIAEHPTRAASESARRGSNRSSVYGANGVSPSMNQWDVDNQTPKKWDQTGNASIQEQFPESSSGVMPGHFQPDSSEDGAGSSFYPIDIQRQFFW